MAIVWGESASSPQSASNDKNITKQTLPERRDERAVGWWTNIDLRNLLLYKYDTPYPKRVNAHWELSIM